MRRTASRIGLGGALVAWGYRRWARKGGNPRDLERDPKNLEQPRHSG